MRPVSDHLQQRATQRPLNHLLRTASQKKYIRAFLTTAFLSTGGFLMMPYSSDFLVHNVGIGEKILPIVFVVAGAVGLITGPLIGKWSDKVGKFRVFIDGSILGTIMVLIITRSAKNTVAEKAHRRPTFGIEGSGPSNQAGGSAVLSLPVEVCSMAP